MTNTNEYPDEEIDGNKDWSINQNFDEEKNYNENYDNKDDNINENYNQTKEIDFNNDQNYNQNNDNDNKNESNYNDEYKINNEYYDYNYQITEKREESINIKYDELEIDSLKNRAERLQDFLIYLDEKRVLSFKIEDYKDGDFIINVGGIHIKLYPGKMPWVYYNRKAKSVIAEYLKGSIFYGIIESLKIQPFTIKIYWLENQFKKINLIVDNEYEGIIINAIRYNIIIEFGHNYNWEYGSVKGFLKLEYFYYSNFENTYNIGDKIVVKFKEIYNNEQFHFYKDVDNNIFYSNRIEKLIGSKVWVRFIKRQHGFGYSVHGKYFALMPINEEIYGEKESEMKRNIRLLRDGQIIKCEIINIKAEYHLFTIKWANYKN